MKADKKKIIKLLNQTFPIPTDAEVDSAIEQIESRLQIKAIKRIANAPVKEGYTMALTILRNRQKDYAGTDALKTTQGRAIAMIAVDYLNGRCSQEILCGVPIKTM